MKLNEEQRNTIVNGLRVAAERFKLTYEGLRQADCPNCQDIPGKDGAGRTCKKCHGLGKIPEAKEGNLRLAKQFERQYADSLELARMIEDAKEISVVMPVVHCITCGAETSEECICDDLNDADE